MPGQLEPNAVCPMCHKSLEALVDTSNTSGVTREYFHEPSIDDGSNLLLTLATQSCTRFFSSHKEAQQERYMLEVHAATQ